MCFYMHKSSCTFKQRCFESFCYTWPILVMTVFKVYEYPLIVSIWSQTHFSDYEFTSLLQSRKLHRCIYLIPKYTQNTKYTFKLGRDSGHLKVISFLSEGFRPYNPAPRIQTWQALLRFLFWFLRKSIRFHLGRLNPSWATIDCREAFILIQQIK